MKLHGDELKNNQIVFVDGKLVTAFVREVDTDEGWVDVEVPVLGDQITVNKEQLLDLKDREIVETFSYEVKRLTGEVKIAELSNPIKD